MKMAKPSSKTGRGYDRRRWKRARALFLAKHPTCRLCAEAGRVSGATVVDHRVPHKGDPQLFWDQSNWQALCTPCHDSTKRKAERSGGPLQGCDEDGLPLDPAHRWNAGG